MQAGGWRMDKIGHGRDNPQYRVQRDRFTANRADCTFLFQLIGNRPCSQRVISVAITETTTGKPTSSNKILMI